MYAGVLLLLAGWSLLAASPLLTVYTAFVAIGFHLRVLLNEEPRLKKQFGEEWVSYAAEVPRWTPGLPGSKSRKGSSRRRE